MTGKAGYLRNSIFKKKKHTVFCSSVQSPSLAANVTNGRPMSVLRSTGTALDVYISCIQVCTFDSIAVLNHNLTAADNMSFSIYPDASFTTPMETVDLSPGWDAWRNTRYIFDASRSGRYFLYHLESTSGECPEAGEIFAGTAFLPEVDILKEYSINFEINSDAATIGGHRFESEEPESVNHVFEFKYRHNEAENQLSGDFKKMFFARLKVFFPDRNAPRCYAGFFEGHEKFGRTHAGALIDERALTFRESPVKRNIEEIYEI